MEGQSFYKLSNEGPAKGGTEAQRWYGELRVSNELSSALWKGREIADWPPEVRFTPKTPGPIEDMPWTGSTTPIMSDRLRTLVEKHAPGQVQFLPVVLRYSNRPLDVGQPYWAANYLHSVDCFDRQLSRYRIVHDGDVVRYSFERMVINSNAVSPKLMIFRVQHQESVSIIRSVLKQILEGNAISGCIFYNAFSN